MERGVSLFDRGVVITAGVVTALLGAVMVAMALGWDGPANAVSRAGMFWRGELAFFGVLAFAAGGWVVTVAVRRPQEREAVLRETELGQVRVTLRAVETLVYRAAGQVEGIRDVEARLEPTPDGVEVFLSLRAAPDTNIPDITDQVQRRVEDYIRETVGLPAKRVHIEVRNVVHQAKPRVE